jgi:hypothetical protein
MAALFIVPVEPDGPGYAAQTYECPKCRFVETAAVRC